MRYRVQGVDRRSGRPVEVTVEAANPGDAAYDAAALGVQVERIDAVEDAPSPPAPPPTITVTAPAVVVPQRDPEETVLIELTSKRIKLGLLIAWLVLAVALALLFAGLWIAWTEQRFDRLGGGLLIASAVVLALGLVLLVVFRFRQWWRHG